MSQIIFNGCGLCKGCRRILPLKKIVLGETCERCLRDDMPELSIIFDQIHVQQCSPPANAKHADDDKKQS